MLQDNIFYKTISYRASEIIYQKLKKLLVADGQS